MKNFYNLLINTLIANGVNNFIWFALVFWIYLETRSVIASSVIGAAYPLLSSLSGIFFGNYVDANLKKSAMIRSSQISFVFYALALIILVLNPIESLLVLSNPILWLFTMLIMIGAVAGILRSIALSTTVSLLVPEKKRDKANGMVGTVNGISFAITSVFSGLAIGQLGILVSLVITLFLTIVVLIHMYSISIEEKLPELNEHSPNHSLNLRSSIKTINKIPGLWGLIFFTMINNLLGGAFFSLLDPYGLELVSVEIWGALWGGLSIAFILGGLFISKYGLGKNPLKVLFLVNIFMWIVSIIFPLRESIYLLSVGMFLYMLVIPVVEAAEQTILQKVVPFASQGRVFGFAQTVENFATPAVALLVGPLAQLVLIPFMTTGAGVELLGSIYGTGINRGIGLIFIISGILGLAVTIFVFNSSLYRKLNKSYNTI